MDYSSFQTLLKELTNHGGSDLHLSKDYKPSIRQHGDLLLMEAYPVNTEEDLHDIVSLLLDAGQIEHLQENRSYDLGYTSENGECFCINIYYESNSLALAIRWINGRILTIEEMNLPQQITYSRQKEERLKIYCDKFLTRTLGKWAPTINTTIHFSVK